MQKVIDISNDIVYIGNEDGSIQEVRLIDCSFEPKVGDSVNVFTSESKVIVTKAEAAKAVDSSNDNIQINIVNESKDNGTHPKGKKVVNKVAYCLLAFFLGGIGVHKFYSGKIGLGFVYLIFFWTYIPALVALVEFIIALTKTSDDQGNILV